MNTTKVRDRRRILRALAPSMSFADVDHFAGKATRWADKLRELGHDPAAYPELTKRDLGGLPRWHTPKSAVFRERYHTLRSHGWSAEEASYASNGPGVFELALRRAAQGKTTLRDRAGV